MSGLDPEADEIENKSGLCRAEIQKLINTTHAWLGTEVVTPESFVALHSLRSLPSHLHLCFLIVVDQERIQQPMIRTWARAGMLEQAFLLMG